MRDNATRRKAFRFDTGARRAYARENALAPSHPRPGAFVQRHEMAENVPTQGHRRSWSPCPRVRRRNRARALEDFVSWVSANGLCARTHADRRIAPHASRASGASTRRPTDGRRRASEVRVGHLTRRIDPDTGRRRSRHQKPQGLGDVLMAVPGLRFTQKLRRGVGRLLQPLLPDTPCDHQAGASNTSPPSQGYIFPQMEKRGSGGDLCRERDQHMEP